MLLLKPVTASIVLLLTLAACSETEKPVAPSAPVVLSNEPVNCERGPSVPPSIEGVSQQEGAAMCRTMSKFLGHAPSQKLLGTMEKMLFGFRGAYGFNEPAKDFAYQVMGVIEARRQVEASDGVMINTMDVITRCYSGSDGHVTPRDLNIELRAAGEMGASMSDDGVYGLAVLIQENKKRHGE